MTAGPPILSRLHAFIRRPSAHRVSKTHVAAEALKAAWSARVAEHDIASDSEFVTDDRTCRGDVPGCWACEDAKERLQLVSLATNDALAALQDGRLLEAVQHAATPFDPYSCWLDDSAEKTFLNAVLSAAYPDLAAEAWRRIEPTLLHSFQPCDLEDVLSLARGESIRHPWPLEDLDQGDASPHSRSLPYSAEVDFDESAYRRLLDWHAEVEDLATELLRRREHRAAHAVLRAARNAHPSCPSSRGFHHSMFWMDRIDAVDGASAEYSPGLSGLLGERLARLAPSLASIIEAGLQQKRAAPYAVDAGAPALSVSPPRAVLPERPPMGLAAKAYDTLELETNSVALDYSRVLATARARDRAECPSFLLRSQHDTVIEDALRQYGADESSIRLMRVAPSMLFHHEDSVRELVRLMLTASSELAGPLESLLCVSLSLIERARGSITVEDLDRYLSTDSAWRTPAELALLAQIRSRMADRFRVVLATSRRDP